MPRFFQYLIVHWLIRREKKTPPVTKQFFNLNNAQKIGIFFQLDDEETYNLVNQLISTLTGQGKHIKVLGFIPRKQVPNYYIASLKTDVFTRKDLNIFGFCTRPAVKHFIAEDFDLLLDLTTMDHPATDYVAGCSHARFKAGRMRNRMIDTFDFMIKQPGEMKSPDFIKTMIHYLQTINTSTI